MTEDERSGRELADELKREALEDLPVLLALWDAAKEAQTAA